MSVITTRQARVLGGWPIHPAHTPADLSAKHLGLTTVSAHSNDFNRRSLGRRGA